MSCVYCQMGADDLCRCFYNAFDEEKTQMTTNNLSDDELEKLATKLACGYVLPFDERTTLISQAKLANKLQLENEALRRLLENQVRTWDEWSKNCRKEPDKTWEAHRDRHLEAVKASRAALNPVYREEVKS